MSRFRAVPLLVFALAAAPLAAEDLPAERRNFVACPIVRDTASVPCWLAEYDGELYFLTLQTDVSAPVTPPWLGHRVLVEGVAAADRPRSPGRLEALATTTRRSSPAPAWTPACGSTAT